MSIYPDIILKIQFKQFDRPLIIDTQLFKLYVATQYDLLEVPNISVQMLND